MRHLRSALTPLGGVARLLSAPLAVSAEHPFLQGTARRRRARCRQTVSKTAPACVLSLARACSRGRSTPPARWRKKPCPATAGRFPQKKALGRPAPFIATISVLRTNLSVFVDLEAIENRSIPPDISRTEVELHARTATDALPSQTITFEAVPRPVLFGPAWRRKVVAVGRGGAGGEDSAGGRTRRV
ncbi:hypothetical protein ABIB87_003761 [Bradyrhizobium sp. JR18.2]